MKMNVHKRKTFKVPGYARHYGNDSHEDNAKRRAIEAMNNGEKEYIYRGIQYVLYNGEIVEWVRATNPVLIGK